MKQTLQLKLSQHLALTPQLQQSIRLLQLSTLELNQELEKFLLENPLLEREEPEHYQPGSTTDAGAADTHKGEPDGQDHQGDASDSGPSPENTATAEDDRWSDSGEVGGEGNYSSHSGSDDDEDSDYQNTQAATTSLADHLHWQLGLTTHTDHDRGLIRLLIEALDEDGYLTVSLEELAESLPEDWVDVVDELQIALRYLQQFDPVGVGARSAQECLLLQLALLPDNPGRQLAQQVVSEHLELLAARDFTRIKKLCACDDEALRQAHALIRSLNPRPGAPFASFDVRYITPDVVVRKLRGQWVANINPEAYPRLRINHLYAEICSQRGSGMSSQLQEARWMIKNIQQRFDTIARVSQAIVDRQRQFFEHGEVAMRPMVLREIAEQLGLHESTVSRVTTQKYMATPRGIFELKYFFGSHVATDTGGACSATAIRALIKQLVGAEDTKKPLSDSQIADILGQQGIVVARRTIAKYREALNIPPVNYRKSL